jgi:hypothetical protein
MTPATSFHRCRVAALADFCQLRIQNAPADAKASLHARLLALRVAYGRTPREFEMIQHLAQRPNAHGLLIKMFKPA